VSTYLKVGKFRILANGIKSGGNVASYFCLSDGSVLHAVAGQRDAQQFLQEMRWASETRKAAQTQAANLRAGTLDMKKYVSFVRKAHGERFHAEHSSVFGDRDTIPVQMPQLATPQAKTHWLLARQPLGRLETIYPIVWRQVLNEELSALPVEK